MHVIAMRKLTSPFTTIPLVMALCLIAAQAVSYSSGPPPGRSGAPGELNCSNGSCHNSFAANSGNASPLISSTVPPSGYEPGETYSVTVSIAEQGITRFGFQALPFNPEGESGTVTITNSDRTKTLTNAGRTYVEHTSSGIDATDSTAWSFDWQAPGPGNGPVTVYASLMASNANGNRQGDYVYTSTLELQPTATASLADLPIVAGGFVGPNPVSSQLRLELDLLGATPLTWRVYSLQGQQVLQGQANARPGRFQSQWSTDHWVPGIYVFELTTNHGRWRQKLVKR